MKTNDVAWEEPQGEKRIDQERQYAEAERRRLVYVAATRARDLLVIPKPSWEQEPEKYIHARLLANPDPAWVYTVEAFIEGRGASWSAPCAPLAPLTDTLDIELLAAWSTARDQAQQPRHAPRSVTGLAKAMPALRVGDTDLEARSPRPTRLSRFGPVFGDAVHRAIGLVLNRSWPASRAVATAAAIVGLADHLDEALGDLERALTALRDANLIGHDRTVRVEYPVAVQHEGHLITGYADLLSATPEEIVVIDFKTDQPTGAEILQVFPEYVRQLSIYAEVVGATRCGLLFTATGQFAWVQTGAL